MTFMEIVCMCQDQNIHPEVGSAVRSGELCMPGICFLLNACLYFSALSWELQETFVDAGALRESEQDRQ